MLPWSAWVYMGGFWLGHFAMIRENSKNWKMGILHFRTGTWILRPESMSVTCNSLFVGLPRYKSGSPPVWNIEWENPTKKRKREQPLGTGFDSHTHIYIYISARLFVFRHDNLDVPHKHGWYYGMVLHGMVWYEWWVWFLLAYGGDPASSIEHHFLKPTKCQPVVWRTIGVFLFTQQTPQK